MAGRSAKDKPVVLGQQSFRGGKHEFAGTIQKEQFLAGENLEFFNGELRTRGGQKWVATLGGRPACDTVVQGGVVAQGASTVIGGLAVGNFWYFQAAWHDLRESVGSPRILEDDEAHTKCIGATFTGAVANALASTVLYQYWDGTDWVDMTAVEYDLSSGRPVPSTRHAQSTNWMVLLNTDEEVAGSDVFWEDWERATVATVAGWWIRVELLTGGITAGCDVTTGTGLVDNRPQGTLQFRAYNGINTIAVARGEPIARGHSDTADVNTLRVIERFQAVDVLDTVAPEDGVRYSMAPTHALAHRYPSTGFLMPGAPTRIPDDYAHRVYRLHEDMSYVERTRRLLCTARTGVLSAVPASDEAKMIVTADQLTDRQLALIEYPDQTSLTNTVRYAGMTMLRDLGSPTAMAEFQNSPFWGYGDGTIRWALATPYEDVVPPEAFFNIADDDGAYITAMKAWGSYLVVFTESSIWLVEPVPDAFIPPANVQAYQARKICSGVGCPSKAAVVEAEGELIFLSYDGLYRFTGTNAPEKLTDSVQKLFDTGLSRPGMRFACGAYYRKKKQLWFSVMRSGSWANDYVIVVDLKTGAQRPSVYTFTDINAEQMVYDNADQRLLTIDRFGRVWEQDVGHGDGVDQRQHIYAWFQTGPLDVGNFNSLQMLWVAVHMRYYPGSNYAVTPIVEGIDGFAQSFDLDYSLDEIPNEGVTESAWGDTAFTFPTDLATHARRKKTFGLECVDGNDIMLKVETVPNATNSNYGERMSLFNIEVRGMPLGTR